MSRRFRSQWPIIGGALAAAVVVVGAFVVIGQQRAEDLPSASSSGGTHATEQASEATETEGAAVPVYYVVDTERAGTRLVREFRQVDDPVPGALSLLGEAPLDPDYRTLVPTGALARAQIDDDQITVDLASRDWTTLPEGMTRADARLAIQQVVYTLQGIAQSRAQVRFVLDDKPAKAFGVTTAKGVSAAGFGVLNQMSITTPEQGQVITAGVLRVTGVGNGFEASVGWEVRDASGARVLGGAAMMHGWLEERLFPFEFTVDVSPLPPGNYTIWTTTDDPTGGTEGAGAMTDDKDFVIVQTSTPSSSLTASPIG
ncbi:MAG: Gmad2 immunoglobulin-like domain-containing protein [Nocardioides sp.]|jgi:hypothetical protein